MSTTTNTKQGPDISGHRAADGGNQKSSTEGGPKKKKATEATNPDDGADNVGTQDTTPKPDSRESKPEAGKLQDRGENTQDQPTNPTRQDKKLSVPLSEQEHSDLKRYREIIDKGLQTFFMVGNALRAIKDDKLYRATHKTFEDYCREEFDMSRTHAYRQVNASVVFTKLAESSRMSPNGDTTADTSILPVSEGQLRPLVSIPKDKQVEAWEETVVAAEKKNVPITAKLVKEVAAKYREEDQKDRPATASKPRITRAEVQSLVDRSENRLQAEDIEGAKKALNEFRNKFLDAA